jgi:hypothetical protein
LAENYYQFYLQINTSYKFFLRFSDKATLDKVRDAKLAPHFFNYADKKLAEKLMI